MGFYDGLMGFNGTYPLVNIQKANWKITIFKNGKPTISMGHFQNVKLPEGTYFNLLLSMVKITNQQKCFLNSELIDIEDPPWRSIVNGWFFLVLRMVNKPT